MTTMGKVAASCRTTIAIVANANTWLRWLAHDQLDLGEACKAMEMGMGLSISRSSVEAYAGCLWVSDNSPRGASFYFSLPTRKETWE